MWPRFRRRRRRHRQESVGAISSQRGGETEAVVQTDGSTHVAPLEGDAPPARQEIRCRECGFLVPLQDGMQPGDKGEDRPPPAKHAVCPPKFHQWPEGEELPDEKELAPLSYREKKTMSWLLGVPDRRMRRSYREVAQSFDITPERVKAIADQAQKKLLDIRAHGPFELPEGGDAEQDGAPTNGERPLGETRGLKVAADREAPRVFGVKDPSGAKYDITKPVALAEQLGEEAAGASIKGPGGKWIRVYVGDVWEPNDPRRKGRVKVLRIIFGKGPHTGFDPIAAECEIKSPSKALNGRKQPIKIESFRPEISRGYKLVQPSPGRPEGLDG